MVSKIAISKNSLIAAIIGVLYAVYNAFIFYSSFLLGKQLISILEIIPSLAFLVLLYWAWKKKFPLKYFIIAFVSYSLASVTLINFNMTTGQFLFNLSITTIMVVGAFLISKRRPGILDGTYRPQKPKS